MIEASHDFKSVSKLEKNRKMIEYMIGTIDQYVDDPRRQHANRNLNFLRRTMALMCFCFGKFLGKFELEQWTTIFSYFQIVIIFLFFPKHFPFVRIVQLFSDRFPYLFCVSVTRQSHNYTWTGIFNQGNNGSRKLNFGPDPSNKFPI